MIYVYFLLQLRQGLIRIALMMFTLAKVVVPVMIIQNIMEDMKILCLSSYPLSLIVLNIMYFIFLYYLCMWPVFNI